MLRCWIFRRVWCRHLYMVVYTRRAAYNDNIARHTFFTKFLDVCGRVIFETRYLPLQYSLHDWVIEYWFIASGWRYRWACWEYRYARNSKETLGLASRTLPPYRTICYIFSSDCFAYALSGIPGHLFNITARHTRRAIIEMIWHWRRHFIFSESFTLHTIDHR